MNNFTVKPTRGQWWLIAPRGTHLRAFPTWESAKATADRANAPAEPQATRVDKLAEQQRQQMARFELYALAPLAVVAVALMGYALGMLFVW